MKATIVPLLVALAMSNCNGPKEVAQDKPLDDTGSVSALAPALVYRTGADHRAHVPIGLSPDRSSIVSYPHPRDLGSQGELGLPTELGGEYLLDNRGIGLNVAFIDMDYRTYANLESAPSLSELESFIIDRDPLVELYDCGPRSRFTDAATDLAQLIKEGTLSTRCKRLK